MTHWTTFYELAGVKHTDTDCWTCDSLEVKNNNGGKYEKFKVGFISTIKRLVGIRTSRKV